MNFVKKYKILAYCILALVVVLSFLLTNLLLNLIITELISSLSIIYILANLILNFSFFFLIFRLIQLVIEKEVAFEELTKQITASQETTVTTEVESEVKEFNTEELTQQIIPHSPQNLNKQQFCEKVLANIAKVSGLVLGIIYIKNKETGEFVAVGKYAYYSTEPVRPFFEGDSLPGQVAKDKKLINVSKVPTNYFKVVSGLGQSSPGNILIFPIIDKDEVIAIAELASFTPFSRDFEKLFEKLATLIGKIIVKLK